MTKPPLPRTHWTPQEIAQMTGLPLTTITWWIRSDQLPASKLGEAGKRGRTLVRIEDWEAFEARERTGGRAG